jgi:hypothetical protein
MPGSPSNSSSQLIQETNRSHWQDNRNMATGGCLVAIGNEALTSLSLGLEHCCQHLEVAAPRSTPEQCSIAVDSLKKGTSHNNHT